MTWDRPGPGIKVLTVFASNEGTSSIPPGCGAPFEGSGEPDRGPGRDAITAIRTAAVSGVATELLAGRMLATSPFSEPYPGSFSRRGHVRRAEDPAGAAVESDR